MNPLNQGHSRTAAKMPRNIFSISQGTDEDESHKNPHPDAGTFNNQMTQNSGPEDGHGMVTRSTEQIRNCHDIIGVHEEVNYCSPCTSRGKQKKNRSTSQPQVGSEHTPATIEGDQILLALQQLAKNNNSANFHNNITRIYKLPKSLTTTMPTFNGGSEKF